eukprot:3954523-Amphidinium_carterae.1
MAGPPSILTCSPSVVFYGKGTDLGTTGEPQLALKLSWFDRLLVVAWSLSKVTWTCCGSNLS